MIEFFLLERVHVTPGAVFIGSDQISGQPKSDKYRHDVN